MPLAESGKPLRIHVGAGLIAPETWVNIDASWNARLAKRPWLRKLLASVRAIPNTAAETPWPRNILIHDIRKGLPFASSSAQAIYASHLIEHLTRDDARLFVRECYRVLKRGGRIRLVTPDLEHLASEYMQAKRSGSVTDDEPASRFLNGLGVLQDFGGTSPLTRLYRRWKSYDLHKWLYDEASLKRLLTESGFAEAERRAYLQSTIVNLADVEHEDRLQGAVCVEACKP